MSEALYCDCDTEYEDDHHANCLVGAIYDVAQELKLLRLGAIKDLKDNVSTNLEGIGIILANTAT